MMNDDDRQPSVNPLLNLLTPENESIRSFTNSIRVSWHHFYIEGEIQDDVKLYLNMIHTLRTCELNDTCLLYINSYGGSVATAIQVINAMKGCEGTVITILDGMAYSSASLILLSGQKYIINPNTSLMAHNYSQNAHGKGHELTSQIKFNESYFKKLYKDIYGGFLTDAEIVDCINGRDIWMDSDEIIARLKKEDIINMEQGDKVEDKVSKPKKKAKKKVKKSSN